MKHYILTIDFGMGTRYINTRRNGTIQLFTDRKDATEYTSKTAVTNVLFRALKSWPHTAVTVIEIA